MTRHGHSGHTTGPDKEIYTDTCVWLPIYVTRKYMCHTADKPRQGNIYFCVATDISRQGNTCVTLSMCTDKCKYVSDCRYTYTRKYMCFPTDMPRQGNPCVTLTICPDKEIRVTLPICQDKDRHVSHYRYAKTRKYIGVSGYRCA